MKTPTRTPKIDPESRWRVATSVSMETPAGERLWPKAGAIYAGSHPAIAHLIRHGAVGTILVPADATDDEVADARRRAAEVTVPEPVPVPAPARARWVCTKRLVIAVPRSTEVGSAPAFVRGIEVGEFVYDEDWILKSHRGTLSGRHRLRNHPRPPAGWRRPKGRHSGSRTCTF